MFFSQSLHLLAKTIRTENDFIWRNVFRRVSKRRSGKLLKYRGLCDGTLKPTVSHLDKEPSEHWCAIFHPHLEPFSWLMAGIFCNCLQVLFGTKFLISTTISFSTCSPGCISIISGLGNPSHIPAHKRSMQIASHVLRPIFFSFRLMAVILPLLDSFRI